eukprot:GHVS01026924.1.p1 GENE.GHVS01026924.1~~GHVS01026924.1.p1  ORF type:complete len:1074 (+),score=129.32 GHVS01026924.1:79-3222(+)
MSYQSAASNPSGRLSSSCGDRSVEVPPTEKSVGPFPVVGEAMSDTQPSGCMEARTVFDIDVVYSCWFLCFYVTSILWIAALLWWAPSTTPSAYPSPSSESCAHLLVHALRLPFAMVLAITNARPLLLVLCASSCMGLLLAYFPACLRGSRPSPCWQRLMAQLPHSKDGGAVGPLLLCTVTASEPPGTVLRCLLGKLDCIPFDFLALQQKSAPKEAGGASTSETKGCCFCYLDVLVDEGHRHWVAELWEAVMEFAHRIMSSRQDDDSVSDDPLTTGNGTGKFIRQWARNMRNGGDSLDEPFEPPYLPSCDLLPTQNRKYCMDGLMALRNCFLRCRSGFIGRPSVATVAAVARCKDLCCCGRCGGGAWRAEGEQHVRRGSDCICETLKDKVTYRDLCFANGNRNYIRVMYVARSNPLLWEKLQPTTKDLAQCANNDGLSPTLLYVSPPSPLHSVPYGGVSASSPNIMAHQLNEHLLRVVEQEVAECEPSRRQSTASAASTSPSERGEEQQANWCGGGACSVVGATWKWKEAESDRIERGLIENIRQRLLKRAWKEIGGYRRQSVSVNEWVFVTKKSQDETSSQRLLTLFGNRQLSGRIIGILERFSPPTCNGESVAGDRFMALIDDASDKLLQYVSCPGSGCALVRPSTNHRPLAVAPLSDLRALQEARGKAGALNFTLEVLFEQKLLSRHAAVDFIGFDEHISETLRHDDEAREAGRIQLLGIVDCRHLASPNFWRKMIPHFFTSNKTVAQRTDRNMQESHECVAINPRVAFAQAPQNFVDHQNDSKLDMENDYIFRLIGYIRGEAGTVTSCGTNAVWRVPRRFENRVLVEDTSTSHAVLVPRSAHQPWSSLRHQSSHSSNKSDGQWESVHVPENVTYGISKDGSDYLATLHRWGEGASQVLAINLFSFLTNLCSRDCPPPHQRSRRSNSAPLWLFGFFGVSAFIFAVFLFSVFRHFLKTLVVRFVFSQLGVIVVVSILGLLETCWLCSKHKRSVISKTCYRMVSRWMRMTAVYCVVWDNLTYTWGAIAAPFWLTFVPLTLAWSGTKT